MKELFEEYPELNGGSIIINRITAEDIPQLSAITDDERVTKTLPTFLYEQKYDDKQQMLESLDREVFENKESILMAVRLASEPEKLVGIAEIYHYEKNKKKASIGGRLAYDVWGNGIAVELIELLKTYLLEELGLSTVTAHVLRGNHGSARAMEKSGFVCKYPGLWEDWGRDELQLTDKYVFKREWLEDRKKTGGSLVQVEQFVMAYGIEQDRIRAMLPDGYRSLRPVLRINAEIRSGQESAHEETDSGREPVIYLEFNTPVEAGERRGWLNIANWKSRHDELICRREGRKVTFETPFLTISFTGTGTAGGCPSEKDNDGCFYLSGGTEFRPAEIIDVPKEFCDCEFAWHYHEGDAEGRSEGRTIPAFDTPPAHRYERRRLTPENAAAIPCRQVLGSYVVRFNRERKNGRPS